MDPATPHRHGLSGPPPDRPPSPAPPPPPAWRNWLLIVGLLVTVALFLLPVPTAGKVEQLSYSQLKSDIAAGQVKSVALGADGAISGTLTNGTKFTSSYPTSLCGPQFVQLLDQHKVQVTTKPAQTSIGSVLLNLLPLAIILGLFLWTGRAARRQLASMGGVAGIGRSRAKVFDAERPETTFGDVAGYEGPSGRWPRWSTSSSTRIGTGGRGRSAPKGCSWWGRRGRARRCWRGRWPGRPMCRSSR